MDLNNIQLFVDVVQKNSFAEVARMRNIDPSSVSRSIRKLETTLGTQIQVFWLIAIQSAIIAVILVILSPWLKRMMHGIK